MEKANNVNTTAIRMFYNVRASVNTLIKFILALKAGTQGRFPNSLLIFVGTEKSSFTFTVGHPVTTKTNFLESNRPDESHWSLLETLDIKFTASSAWATDAGSIASLYFAYLSLTHYVLMCVKELISVGAGERTTTGKENTVAVEVWRAFYQNTRANSCFNFHTRAFGGFVKDLYRISIGGGLDFSDPSFKQDQHELETRTADFELYVFRPVLDIFYKHTTLDVVELNYSVAQKTRVLDQFRKRGAQYAKIQTVYEKIATINKTYAQASREGLERITRQTYQSMLELSSKVAAGFPKLAGVWELGGIFDKNRIAAFSFLISKKFHECETVKAYFELQPNVNIKVVLNFSMLITDYGTNRTPMKGSKTDNTFFDKVRKELEGFYTAYLKNRFEFVEIAYREFLDKLQDEQSFIERNKNQRSSSSEDEANLDKEKRAKQAETKKAAAAVKTAVLAMPFFESDEVSSAYGRLYTEMFNAHGSALGLDESTRSVINFSTLIKTNIFTPGNTNVSQARAATTKSALQNRGVPTWVSVDQILFDLMTEYMKQYFRDYIYAFYAQNDAIN